MKMPTSDLEAHPPTTGPQGLESRSVPLWSFAAGGASQTSFTAVWKDQNHHVGSFLPLGYSIPLSAVPKG